MSAIDYKHRAGCRGKVRYSSVSAGIPELLRLRAQPHEIIKENEIYATRLNVYECEFCTGFHIGHSHSKPAWISNIARRLEAAFTKIQGLDLTPEQKVRKMVGAVIRTIIFVVAEDRQD